MGPVSIWRPHETLSRVHRALTRTIPSQWPKMIAATDQVHSWPAPRLRRRFPCSRRLHCPRPGCRGSRPALPQPERPQDPAKRFFVVVRTGWGVSARHASGRKRIDGGERATAGLPQLLKLHEGPVHRKRPGQQSIRDQVPRAFRDRHNWLRSELHRVPDPSANHSPYQCLQGFCLALSAAADRAHTAHRVRRDT